MLRNFSRAAMLWALGLATFMIACQTDLIGSPRAEAAHRYRTSGDLFYNYYVGPCGTPAATAQLYVCPRPVPPLVGHTYVTYEPLMPQEFLYKHYRKYQRYNPGAGWTTTRVLWY